MSPAPNDGRHQGFLRFWDLLIIVIVSLGTTMLLSVVAARLADRAGVGTLPPAGIVLIFLGLQNLCFLGTVYLVAVRWRGLAWSDLGLRPTDRFWYVRAVYLGLVAYLLIALTYALVGQLLGELPVNPQISLLAPAGTTFWGAAAMALMVCLVAPFVEEILFRGILYAWLRRRWGMVLSSLVSGICFSLLHGIVWLIPAIALLGVLLAVIYEKSGSLWPSIVTHATFNTMTLILLYTLLSQGMAPH
jgi:membrane protease YdiL (CAAX protease family)